jgi:hypothetical protein
MPFEVIRARAALGLVLLLGCADRPPGEAIAPAELAIDGDSTLPIVEVVRAGPYAGIGSDAFARNHYTDVYATIAGSFTRPWDGSTGSYKVPLRLVYPDFCASSAVVETVHPNFIGEPLDVWKDFHIPGQSDPDFDPLFDLSFNEAFSNIGARGLFGRPPEQAHVYAGLLADSLSGVLEYVAAQPANQPLGLHLSRPTDLGFVFAGVSRWLREHGPTSASTADRASSTRWCCSATPTPPPSPARSCRAGSTRSWRMAAAWSSTARSSAETAEAFATTCAAIPGRGPLRRGDAARSRAGDQRPLRHRLRALRGQ